MPPEKGAVHLCVSPHRVLLGRIPLGHVTGYVEVWLCLQSRVLCSCQSAQSVPSSDTTQTRNGVSGDPTLSPEPGAAHLSVRTECSFIGHHSDTSHPPSVAEYGSPWTKSFIYLLNRDLEEKKRRVAGDIQTRPPPTGPTAMHLARTPSHMSPLPGGCQKEVFPRGDGAKSRET